MDYGVSRRAIAIALTVLVLIYVIKLTGTTQTIIDLAPSYTGGSKADKTDAANDDKTKSGSRIRDRVAMLSDTQYSTRLIPLIMHFKVVLGPDWPIVFFTTQENIDKNLLPPVDETAKASGAIPPGSDLFRRAVAAGDVELRVIPDKYNMTDRNGVNIYLSEPWLWEQLAPAEHVLVFQTDAMLCANAHQRVDDFLEWDFIAAPLHPSRKVYNGGLSLRNRTMMLEILADPANNWEAETKAGTWTQGGEDVWFSVKMDQRGAHLPPFDKAISFACQHEYHINKMKEPVGYHKVHKYSGKKLPEISAWCPEIALAAPGTLAQ